MLANQGMVHITPALVRWDVPDFLHPIPTTPAADRNIHHLLLALTYDPIHLLYINQNQAVAG